MRVLSANEIHAVSGSATTGAVAESKPSPISMFFVGLMWVLAGLFGTGFKGIV